MPKLEPDPRIGIFHPMPEYLRFVILTCSWLDIAAIEDPDKIRRILRLLVKIDKGPPGKQRHDVF